MTYDHLHRLQQIGTCTICSRPVTRNHAGPSSPNCSVCHHAPPKENCPELLRKDVQMSILSLTLMTKVLQALETQLEKLISQL